jgi:hypothetical protein
MKLFNPSSSHPHRALQAWQILIAGAMQRQTFTYLGLSRLMFQKDAAGVLDKILGHIAFYCIDNDLPALTTIVVGKTRGTPGADIPVDPNGMDSERERVYEIDWFNVCPPSPDDLAASFAKHF